MVGKRCRTCCWYDPDYECTLPDHEPWLCVYDEKAAAELEKALLEWKEQENEQVQ